MSNLNSQSDLDAFLKEYLGKNTVLIVDPISSARVSLAANLSKLGAAQNKMVLVSSVEEARLEIAKSKPKVVFTEFMVGEESGLDLLQDQKDKYLKEELKETLFVLVTHNVCQSTVARAVEEDVDTFIVKPYTIDSLRKILSSSVNQKLNPSRYLQLIEMGKDKLIEQKFDEAIEKFAAAMLESETPTLACFYAGQAEFMKAAVSSAEQKYERGLSYNKIHYKCLVGLHDLLLGQKKYYEAYDIIRRLAQSFPANPKRLTSILRLAILTENFEDMEGYYRIFLKLNERTDELIKYMCSALVATGKYYLRKKMNERAIQWFESSAVTAAGRAYFLAYIVENLVEFKLKNEAERFLDRLAKLAPDTEDYKVSRFLVATLGEDLIGAIQLGRNLVREGVESPAVYEKLIMLSVKGNYPDAVTELFQVACKKWPSRQNDFLIAKQFTQSA